MECRCVLCNSESIKLETYTVSDYEKGYLHHYGKKVEKLFDREYSMWKCNNCGLVFSNPMVGGTKEYYEWVTKQEGYYATDRWEWHRIADYIKSKPDKDIITILEVGCGEGFFLDFIKRELPQVKIIGVDLTQSSIDRCLEKGHDAFCGTLEEYLEINSDKKYDYVVSFHCLEHVFNPKEYVEEMLKACKSDGLCINSIPYTVETNEIWWDVLNSPPHHMTRWCVSAINELGIQVGAKIEMLAEDTFDAYQEAITSVRYKYYNVHGDKKKVSSRKIKFLHFISYYKEVNKNLKRETLLCSEEIGGKKNIIQAPFHVCLIFRR